MQPWHQNERLRIAAVALAAGLILGGLVALAVGHPKLTRFGKPQKSTADAIASDQPIVAARDKAKKAKAKPDEKAHKARKSPRRSSAGAAFTATPDATATPDGKNESTDTTAAPRPAAAAPRRRRVTSPVISQPRRRTPTKASPDPTAAPAPASTPESTAAPTPAPTEEPKPEKTPRPEPPGLVHGNGNCHDPPTP
jgi:hypothetical protein